MWLLLLHAPPAPFVPAEWHGRQICALAVCYSGDLARTDETLAPIRALGNLILDLLHDAGTHGRKVSFRRRGSASSTSAAR